MARFSTAMMAFNRGLVSDLALGRIDLKRLALSAEIQENYMPRTLGSMMLRPGLRYVAETLDSQEADYIPFIFSITDTALIELTPGKVRVLVDEEYVTRPAVSTTVTNPNFDTNLTGWTDADESGGASVWATGGYASLTGNGTNAAILKQTLTIALADQNVEHALDIETIQGKLSIRVGSTDGDDDLISETELGVGNHSLAFTPTGGSVFVQLFNRRDYKALVSSVDIAPAGIMEIEVPWVLNTYDKIRYAQSGDVIFVCCEDFQQKRIERRGPTSWSTIWYRPDDGPFDLINLTPIRLSASAISGNITVTASKPLFKSTNLNSLYRITSTGQQVNESITAQDTWSDPIRVTGVDSGRVFGIVITGLTGTGNTVRLQRSVEEPGNWTNVSSYTTNQTINFDDTLDNQIIYYRIGIATGEYSTGTTVVQLTYSAGSISGIIRVTSVTSSTVVEAEVLQNLGGTASTVDWEEGAWSDRRGWPSAVCLHEGRLWWAGKDRVWGSVSDAFQSFDSETEGDSGPISRSIGQGPVDTLNWMLSLQRLLVGGQAAEYMIQSSSIDEPLTPSNFSLKPASTQGSKRVAAVRLDNSGFFVQRGGSKLYELNQQDQFSSYNTLDATSLVPLIGNPGIIRIIVQRQPDTRIHCIKSDGTVAILVYDSAEQVKCWVTFVTDGEVESGVVIPGAPDELEDKVYYLVKRTINGSTKRFLERWANEVDCQGDELNHQADSYIIYDGAATDTIPVPHLEATEVTVWADGAYLGEYTVTSGEITLDVQVTKAIVGITYQARFKSTKLAYTADTGTPLNQIKRVDNIGFILTNTHNKGVRFGRDFTNMDDLPRIYQGREVGVDEIFAHHDQLSFPFPGEWNTDSRVCLTSQAPKPCTILAATLTMSQNDKI